MVVIEEALLKDIDALCKLLKILFSQEVEFCFNDEKQKKGLEMIINNPQVGRIYLLKEKGIVVGMVSLLFSVSTALGEKVAWLEDMVIDPEFQNMGYGKKLLSEALEEMKKRTCKRVRLLTDSDNAKAQNLYASLGFSHSSMQAMYMLIP